jgi:putative membrane protein
MKFITKLIVSSLAVILIANYMTGIKLNSPIDAVILAASLAFLNSILKPLLILFTLPITLFSFGIFLIFINAFIIYVADYFIDGFWVESAIKYFYFSILLSITTSILEFIANLNKDEQ